MSLFHRIITLDDLDEKLPEPNIANQPEKDSILDDTIMSCVGLYKMKAKILGISDHGVKIRKNDIDMTIRTYELSKRFVNFLGYIFHEFGTHAKDFNNGKELDWEVDYVTEIVDDDDQVNFKVVHDFSFIEGVKYDYFGSEVDVTSMIG